MMQRRHGLLIGSVFIYLLSVFSAANAGGTRVIIAYSSINPNSSQLEIGRAVWLPEISILVSSAARRF